MNPFAEDDLIAYHLGELGWLRRRQLGSALEKDAVLAAESEAIAETLRAFSAEAAPVVDDAVLERAWQRMRPSLEVLTPARQHRTRTVWMVGAGSALAGAAAVVVVLVLFGHRVPAGQEAANAAQPQTIAARAHDLLTELQGKSKTGQSNSTPGGMTLSPDAVAEDPSLAVHLDTAERVLTEVSHSDGRLQPETQQEVHQLMLENAVYYTRAETRGDMSTAAVIDDLGRVLTSLDAEPRAGAHDEDAFQLQVTVGNVLLDLRILHHNSAPSAPPASQVSMPAEKSF